MNVVSKIVADLTRPNIGARVNAVQGDGNTRLAEITLLCGGVTWTPPEGVEAAIAYMQPGGTKGLYNKLADGTAAISITGNVATVILAPQMLTVSGTAQASLVFNDQQLNRLTTFPFAVQVVSNPAYGAQKTEDYIRLQWLEDKLTDAINTALAQAKASGEFDGADGKPGKNGSDGYSPAANVTQNENGATITITDKNGTTTATVTNGKDGIDGSPGKDGSPGADGQDGITPTIGENGNWYLGNTDTGKPSRGETGPAGADGYTPVKGTDYFTEADKTEMTNAVLAALPAAEGASF